MDIDIRAGVKKYREALANTTVVSSTVDNEDIVIGVRRCILGVKAAYRSMIGGGKGLWRLVDVGFGDLGQWTGVGFIGTEGDKALGGGCYRFNNTLYFIITYRVRTAHGTTRFMSSLRNTFLLYWGRRWRFFINFRPCASGPFVSATALLVLSFVEICTHLEYFLTLIGG